MSLELGGGGGGGRDLKIDVYAKPLTANGKPQIDINSLVLEFRPFCTVLYIKIKA